MEMQGITQEATLKEVVISDPDVIQLIANSKIKKMIVNKCPINLLKNIQLLHFEEVHCTCEISDQFRSQL